MNKDKYYFEIKQYDQPIKYISIPKNETVIDLHKKLSKIIDCSAKIRDICLSYNNQNIVSIPADNKILSINDFIESNNQNIDISFNYYKGFTYTIFVMDDKCITYFKQLRIQNEQLLSQKNKNEPTMIELKTIVSNIINEND